MAKPTYPDPNNSKRVLNQSTQDEIDQAIGKGKFIFGLVFHEDGSIDNFTNKELDNNNNNKPTLPIVHGPTKMRDDPQSGELEEWDGSAWKKFVVTDVLMIQNIQIITVKRNPVCKVIVYPDGTKVHYHMP